MHTLTDKGMSGRATRCCVSWESRQAHAHSWSTAQCILRAFLRLLHRGWLRTSRPCSCSCSCPTRPTEHPIAMRKIIHTRSTRPERAHSGLPGRLAGSCRLRLLLLCRGAFACALHEAALLTLLLAVRAWGGACSAAHSTHLYGTAWGTGDGLLRLPKLRLLMLIETCALVLLVMELLRAAHFLRMHVCVGVRSTHQS